ncbi:MAG TPA: UDP-N-acetylmuramoyl-tripeptide--D-alanyl-D-alanine ligase, partial [Solirubrobacterales bacterium]|nr:UDP-N-acetylmuramoyl-tripeptide--D-alanyl-D-alanine ligase [Solirubrobacterales bacterium]
GIRGEHVDGGRFAGDALSAGAWGVLVDPVHAAELADRHGDVSSGRGWILSSSDPAASLQALARAWRRTIGCPLVGITGSTGKTSVKDITKALLPRHVHASPQNYNTEIGMPLALLSAPRDTEILVMEMAMRGLGQIEQLCEIAEPDVAAITNIGPVHLELLGTIEAIAAAKAEILQGLGDRGRAVIPEDAEALDPHLHDSLITFTFGAGGDVFVESSGKLPDGRGMAARIGTPHGEADFEFPFTEGYNLQNALCAVAIGVALDLDPAEMAERTSRIEFSRLRGERVELSGGILLLNDCYNANPTSMRAALEHLAGQAARGRRIAILGGMAELGPTGPEFHEELAALARELGIASLIGVGELARHYSPDRWVADAREAAELAAAELESGDVALIKGSRAVGLELVADQLRIELGEAAGEGEGS